MYIVFSEKKNATDEPVEGEVEKGLIDVVYIHNKKKMKK